ncbi:MAG: NAD(P)-dependent oxidoreductase [Actinobacteria bacterium]|nr:NAD(P)-dependent oxidoreductase [Actinomycetota bacterium]
MSNTSPKILVLGATGLVGSRFLDLYKEEYDITTIGRSSCDIIFNILDFTKLYDLLINSSFDFIINYAAYTNVDGAENEKNNKEGEVYKLNVLLPYYLAKACSKKNKNLYHISTDYVFDGQNEDKPYTEDYLPQPVDSWYCKTKYEGEVKIAEGFNGKNLYSIVRISYPFSGLYSRKFDIARIVVDRLQKGEEYAGVTNQKIKPTHTDTIASAIQLLIKDKSSGIYHVAGQYTDGFITPFEFAKKITETFNLDSSLIKPVSFESFSKTRVAKRPQHTWIDTGKIEKIGLKLPPLEQVLRDFKKQLLLSN